MGGRRSAEDAERGSFGETAAYWGVRGLLGALSLLPWATRSSVAGWIGRTAVTRIPKFKARVHANLNLVMPHTTLPERDAIAAAAGTCFGRTALELFSARDFNMARTWTEPDGPGLRALREAIHNRTGAVLVSGHYGGWEAGRAWIKAQGADCAAVYRPMGNPRLNRFYRDSLATTGGPVLPKDRRVVRSLVRHMGAGGIVALLVDQHDRRAEPLDFMGHPAPTTLIPAELALKFGVPLIPAFAPRSADGQRINLRLGAPVPHTTPKAMMQAVNDALSEEVRANPGQYYWLHRRWAKDLPGLSS